MTEPKMQSNESTPSISNQSMTSSPDQLNDTVQQLSCLYLEEDTEDTEITLGTKSEYTYEEICRDFCKVYYKYNDELEEDDENSEDRECKEDEKSEAKAGKYEEPNDVDNNANDDDDVDDNNANDDDDVDDNNVNDDIVDAVDIDEYYDSDFYDNYYHYETYEESDFYSDAYDGSDYSSDYSYGYIDERDEIWYY